jgi:hypothetical protein
MEVFWLRDLLVASNPSGKQVRVGITHLDRAARDIPPLLKPKVLSDSATCHASFHLSDGKIAEYHFALPHHCHDHGKYRLLK